MHMRVYVATYSSVLVQLVYSMSILSFSPPNESLPTIRSPCVPLLPSQAMAALAAAESHAQRCDVLATRWSTCS